MYTDAIDWTLVRLQHSSTFFNQLFGQGGQHEPTAKNRHRVRDGRPVVRRSRTERVEGGLPQRCDRDETMPGRCEERQGCRLCADHQEPAHRQELRSEESRQGWCMLVGRLRPRGQGRQGVARCRVCRRRLCLRRAENGIEHFVPHGGVFQSVRRHQRAARASRDPNGRAWLDDARGQQDHRAERNHHRNDDRPCRSLQGLDGPPEVEPGHRQAGMPAGRGPPSHHGNPGREGRAASCDDATEGDGPTLRAGHGNVRNR